MDTGDNSWENLKLKDDDIRDIVLSYLVHNCYKKTAIAFCRATNQDPTEKMGGLSIDHRKYVTDLVRSRQVMESMKECEERWPGMLEKSSDVVFQLKTQVYVEFIRAGDVKGALEYAREHLTPVRQDRIEEIEDLLALLAYDDPSTSPVGHYLSAERLDNVADQLNAAILLHETQPSQASMKQLMQHLTVLAERLQQDAGVSGQKWRLSDYLKEST
eukprot:Rmarinus@m.5753